MSLCVDFREIEDYPKEDEYYSERMKTFENCSDEDIINPEKWARAGFNWNPTMKTIRCQYCFTTIHHVNCEDFKRDDHCAIKEHVKRNPTCKFVAPFLQKPCHPEMIDERKRWESFEKPCGTMIISHEELKKELVDMGAFCKQYNETDDHHIRCYHCDVSLSWIRNEEISIGTAEEERMAFIKCMLIEHAAESPECAHMIQLKGIEYIEEALDGLPWEHGSEYTIESEEEALESIVDETEKLNIAEIMEYIDKRYLNMPDADEKTEDTRLDTDNIEKFRCKICLTNESNVLFLPCRHFAACTTCNKRIPNECHICRQVIDKKINIYM